MRQRAGFTLIELLVVIAIIAILAAILFPVFSRARAKARATACLSNEKQLALAFMQYTMDHDGRFPSVYDDTGPVRVIWAEKIYPYVRNNQVYACPGGPNNVNTSTTLHGTRYLMNMVHGWHWPEGTNSSGNHGYPINEDQIRQPAELALLFEGRDHWWCHWLTHPGWNATTTNADGLVLVGVLGETIYPRHNGGCNVAFCDGHVKWMKTQDIYSTDPYDHLFVLWAQ
ncbi:MAG: DUF1559 domain-containing protein [Armatimonadota bacterium]